MKKARKASQGPGRRRWRVPPPESEIWPEEFRGERWKSIYATLFAGRCQVCAYSCPLPKTRQWRDRLVGVERLLLCTNREGGGGELCEVLPIDTCRNFKPKPWQPQRSKGARRQGRPGAEACDDDVRRIPLGNGLFALVDAADYKRVSKYRWYAKRHGSVTYATCLRNGRVVYMHRMIMRPPKGYIVDHIDGNGLNNRRCNLRICTHQQNQANRGPRGGSSQFVGVLRHGDKWEAGIRCQGKYHYLGLFEDEVEAAKARDRKAYELHGPYAYLNFPEDFSAQGPGESSATEPE